MATIESVPLRADLDPLWNTHVEQKSQTNVKESV